MAWMGGLVVRFEGELDGGVRVYELGGLVDADGQWWGGGSGKGMMERWFDFGGKAGGILGWAGWWGRGRWAGWGGVWCGIVVVWGLLMPGRG
jgi:hypothetical protein